RWAPEDALGAFNVGGVVADDEGQCKKAVDRPRAHVRHAGYAIHGHFDRDRDLLLDLLGGDAGPLRDDFDVVVGDVGIGLYRKVVERQDAPGEEQNAHRYYQDPVLKREIDQLPDHCASTVPSNATTSRTTC